MNSGARPLGRVRDLADGGARGFEHCDESQDAVFVVRLGNAVYGYVDRCPHQGARLPWRRDAYLNSAGDRIVCFAHGAEFDVATGECLLGPCLGQALTRVNLKVTEQGEIFATSASMDGGRA